MIKKNKPDFIAKLAWKALAAEIFSLLIIYFFTKSVVYCIISFTGAAISIAGYALLIQSTDRLLKKGKGKTMFFLMAQAKLLLIAGTFYALSRLAGIGVVFFIQGISVIYLAILAEGLIRLPWGKANHGT
jgi:hypothetical protein